jgi:4-hydroxybenzoate polyprenyltransferase
LITYKIKTFFELIKFEHTVFALPFAYMGLWMANKNWPSWRVFLGVTIAMVSARTVGMTLNRIIDRVIDAKNPRTKKRALVTGDFSVSAAWTAVAISTVIFFMAASWLNLLCFQLSPVALILLSGYHYVKRFSFLCHFALGAVLGIAPMGGWLAVTGQFSWVGLILSFAVMVWVAGFDILYGLQDMDFDKSMGLHSIPVRFGLKQSLKISSLCHVAAIFFFALFGFAAHLGILYACGVLVTAVLLKVEHALVSEGDLSRLNTAFFAINGWVGVLLFVFAFLDVYR